MENLLQNPSRASLTSAPVTPVARMVRYLSKSNYLARDRQGRFEGTFRWRWLASLWAITHPQRPMYAVRCTGEVAQPPLRLGFVDPLPRPAVEPASRAA
jgi:hypothetical protein